MNLSETEIKRYHRQMMMKGWGEGGQERLKASTVFIAGAGGLGSPVSMYLAAAGVGTIRICDFDFVDFTNLNRQILHDHTRVSMNKAISGKKTLEQVNPEISIVSLQDKIVAENVDQLVGDADIVIDCLDNFPARYFLNDCAIRKDIPLVFGGIWGMDGRLAFIRSPETACLRCIFPEAPPIEAFPVVGATAGVIGSLQALETVKYLTQTAPILKGELLVWEGGTAGFYKFKTKKDPACPSCGDTKPHK